MQSVAVPGNILGHVFHIGKTLSRAKNFAGVIGCDRPCPAPSSRDERPQGEQIAPDPLGIRRKFFIGHTRLPEQGEQHLGTVAILDYPHWDVDTRAIAHIDMMIHDAESIVVSKRYPDCPFRAFGPPCFAIPGERRLAEAGSPFRKVFRPPYGIVDFLPIPVDREADRSGFKHGVLPLRVAG